MTDNQDQPIRAEDLASAARLTAARYDPGTGDLHAVAKQVVEERFGSAGTKAAQDISPEEWINEVAQCAKAILDADTDPDKVEQASDRKIGVLGKSVYVRVGLGGRRKNKKKK